MEVKKVVVIGPESTGKSMLCESLAQHFEAPWVEEYAREYLLKNGTNYSREDLFTIAQGQLRLEDEGLEKAKTSGSGFLFIDTDMYVMKVWSEFVFNCCDNRILNEIVKRRYHLYLLAQTDLPWVKDELREYPDLDTREKLFHYYKDILVNQATPWAMIGGIGNQRFNNAIQATTRLLPL